MIEREVVVGDGIPPTIGPYSAAIKAGDFVYVSGQPGVDPATGEPAGPTLEKQARQAMKNLEAVLRAAESGLEHVVNTTVLVADMSEFAVVNDLFAEAFPVAPPARMTMQVPLPRGLLISIGCVAIARSSA